MSSHDVHYYSVATELNRYSATVHRGDLTPHPVRLPAMLGQLWVCTAPAWLRQHGVTTPQQLPAFTLLGFTTASFEVFVERPAQLYGLGFWPLGWAELVPRTAGACSDRLLDASEVWPALPDIWGERSAGERDCSAALQRVAVWLAQQAVPSEDAARIGLIDRWLNSTDGPAELVRQLGVSSRQAERITARTHGGSPRLIAGKWRALRAAAELEASDDPAEVWSRYADQSHFIREFRRFVGRTPGSYRKDSALTGRILADAWHERSDHPLSLRASRTRGIAE